jgi:DNA-binding winged helix-turn-helix (wHTH) protein
MARFGVFELDLQSGELRKQGVKLKLQGKAFLLLKSLIERRGEVVTREELQRTLWPAGVFVEADSGLNTAANRLRFALGDSAEAPRYIETLARTGYRFIAPVEIIDSEPARTAPAARGRTAATPLIVLTALAVIALVVSATTLAFRQPRPTGVQFRQVTFRHGQVGGARFAPDGHAILYSAAWDNEPRRLYLTNPYSPESRRLGIDDARLVAVSRSGELALLSSDGNSNIAGGVLARVPMNGGAPVAVDRNIMSADWSSDGRLAVVRAADGINQLEFPAGHVLHKTPGWISGIRMAPRGERIAFIEHPVRHDNRGTVRVIETEGPPRSLTQEWAVAGGLAWHPNATEVWFTASRDGEPKSLWAATLDGDVRSVSQIAGAMTLRDMTTDGRALVTRETEQLEMTLVNGNSPPENLSWLDWSRVADISPDGRLILFDETGVAAGSRYRIYLHRRDTHATMLLGEGSAMALSPDGRFALTLDANRRTRFHLVPIGEAAPVADSAAGKTVDLPPTGLEYQWARYFPDGQRLLALASEPDGPLRLYVQPLSGKPYPITPPIVVRNIALSATGDRVAVLSGRGSLVVYPTAAGGAAQEIATTGMLAPLLWTPDDWLYVQHIGAYTQIPTRVSRLRLADGRLEPVRDLRPSDVLGVNAITKVMISPDTKTIVFDYRRVLSELFVLEPSAPTRDTRVPAGS